MRPPITDNQFSALVEEHKGIIYKIANSYCRHAEDRKDLIQEIVIQLWKSHDRYDDRFKLSTWIYRIALNVAISAYRREKKRSERVAPPEEIIVEPAADSEPPDPKIATLHRIIGQLDELNRALMILYLEDNSYRDIAGILGLTETNVATKINRLKLKIKEQFTQTNTDLENTMELDELKQTWNEHARKLDRILSLNLQGLKTAQLDKTRSALGRFKAFRLFEIALGILILIPLGSYIADRISVPTLAIPALVVAASVLVPVVANIRQLILLGRISYADPVTSIQRKLEEIKLQYLRSFRLPVLMLPLYMAYVVVGLNLVFGTDVLAQASAAYLWANLAFSLILVAPAIWILRHLSFKNTDNPVIRALVHGNGGKQMVAALEFLKALQEFEAEENGTVRQAVSR